MSINIILISIILINVTNSYIFENNVSTNFLRGLSSFFFERNITSIVSEECREDIIRSYDFENKTDNESIRSTYFYVYKMTFCSFRNNILAKYQQCLSKFPHINNISEYYMATVKITNKTSSKKKETEKNVSEIKTSKAFYGFCFPSELKCSNKEYSLLIETFYKIVNSSETINILNGDIYKVKKTKEFNIKDYIPLIVYSSLVLLQIIIILFNIFPLVIYKSLFKQKINNNTPKRKRESNKKINDEIGEAFESPLKGFIDPEDMENFEGTVKSKLECKTNIIEYDNFKSSLKLGKNIDDLFDHHSKACLNSNGITYIFGLRGLAFFPYIFGINYLVAVNSIPSTMNNDTYNAVTNNPLFGIIAFGLRYSPKIFLSCSGYCLFYKFISFLDDCYDGMIEANKKPTEKDTEQVKVEDLNKSEFSDDDSESEHKKKLIKTFKPKKIDPDIRSTGDQISEYIFEPDKLKIKFLFMFLMSQIHKYLIYVLLLIFIYFCVFHLIVFIRDNGPFWQYCYKNVINVPISKFIQGVFAVHTLTAIAISSEEREDFLNYYFIPMQEMLFFILTSFILFISYKYKIKITHIFVGIITLYAIIKVLLFVIDYPENYIRNTQLFQILENFGKLFYHPIYNYPYYLLGCIFGAVNYLIQKGIYKREQLEDSDKPLLLFSYKILCTFRHSKKITIFFYSVIGIILIIILSEIQPIFSLFKKIGYSNIVNEILNFILLIDSDIVVFFLHTIFLGLYIKANPIMTGFLNHRFWIFTEKTYFILILLINFMAVYVFYQNESENIINISEIFLYGTFCGFLSFFGMLFSYIFVEEPLRKINKVIINKKLGKY